MKRGNPHEHKYEHGKQKEPISFDEFKAFMEKGYFSQRSHRSFLAFLYWFGVRKTEALERVREDFQVESGVLNVDVLSLKGGEDRPPLEIDVDMPYVNLILEQVALTRPRCRVWNFSDITAWRIVKRATDKLYPHFFRLNRCTRMLDDPTTTIPEIKGWFAWKDVRTISSYVGLSKRHIKKGRERLRREVE